MNILQIHNHFFRRYGTEHHLFDISETLASWGHDVVPFSMQDDRNAASPWDRHFIREIDLERVAFTARALVDALGMVYRPETRRKLRNLLRETRPDVAHIHLVHHHLSPALLPELARQRIPVVQTLHNYKLLHPCIFPWAVHGRCEAPMDHRWNKLIFHACYKESLAASVWLGIESTLHKLWGVYERHVDHWVAPSLYVRDRFVRAGYPEARISVVPHGIDLQRFDPAFGHEGYLLFFGRLAPERGVDRLIDAMGAVPEARLLIAGDGPLLESLRARAAARAPNNVEFIGYRHGAALRDLVRGARAVLMPSLFPEVFGLSALEAMAFGKPLLASDRGALPELVAHGESGWLFDPENEAAFAAALRACLDAPDRRLAEMGAVARSRAEAFGLRRCVTSLLGLYRRLAAS